MHNRSMSTLVLALLSASGCVADLREPGADDSLATSIEALSGTGLKGEYYDNIDFTNLKVTRTDSTVNFNWGSGSPDPLVGADTFSVRWTGQVVPQFSQTYTFYTQSDDGVRLWINGTQLVNNWTNHGPTENSGTIALTSGTAYSVKMEFYENGGGAVAKLSWSSASQAKQIIPQSQLFPPGSGTGSALPVIDGCTVFPADNPWNRDVSSDPIDPNSANFIANIQGNGSGQFLHADFGSNPSYGIPYVSVAGTQAKVPMTFDYVSDSDPGPYPFPANAPIEGGSGSTGDRHVLVLERDSCTLYETWDSHYLNPGWHCGSGAIFHFNSNALRPDGNTSADAAGLPILPGLVRYAEAVSSGTINHALRFTVSKSQRAFVHPATHYASSLTGSNYPPMGMRVRLKASFDLSGFSGASKVVLTALKKYGMYVADNGSNWFISGVSDSRFDDNNLNQLKSVSGSAFEVVQLGTLHK
jgi:PA14 domain